MPSERKVEEVAKKLADELFIEPTDLQVRPIVDALLELERETRREALLEAAKYIRDNHVFEHIAVALERKAEEAKNG